MRLPKEKHPIFLMKMVSDRADAAFLQQVGDLGLTAPQCRLLMYLEAQEGRPVSQRELEKYLGVSHTTVKGLLNRLSEKGHVRTAFDSADGRVKHAYLTDSFRQMRAEAEEKLRSFECRLVAGFSVEELAILRHMLERIYYNTSTTEP